MSLKIVFDLNENDLKHFQREMRKARAAVRVAEDEEIINAARDVLETVRSVAAPGFVMTRLEKLDAHGRSVSIRAK